MTELAILLLLIFCVYSQEIYLQMRLLVAFLRGFVRGFREGYL